MMITQAYSLETELKQTFRELTDFVREKRYQEIAGRVDEEMKKLEDNLFYLVVLGQFKRGKTTLINALLGENLLPTAVVPLTSVITLIRYGKNRSVTVNFLNGTSQNILFHELPFYITERENPMNSRGVKVVEITLPSSFLEGGVVLVDTPGIGSTFLHNTETSYDFLPRADAALFVLSVDPPLSEAEGRYLTDVASSVSTLFFVLNKVDYLDEADRQESLHFSRSVIESYLGKDGVKIYPVEAKNALAAKLASDLTKLNRSGLTELEVDLQRFFRRKKVQVGFLAAIRRGLEYCQEVKGLIDLEKKAAELPARDLESRIGAFEEQLKQVHHNRKDAMFIMEGEIKGLVKEVEEDLSHLQEKLKPVVNQTIGETANALDNLPILSFHQEIEARVNEVLTAEFEKWKGNEEQKISTWFEAILGRFVQKMNGILAVIREISAGIFDVELSGQLETETLTTKSNFYYKFGREGAVLMPTSLSISALLPRALARKKVIQQATDNAFQEIERNCGRIRADFAERTQKSFLSFRYTFEERVEEMIQSIRNILSDALKRKSLTDQEFHEAYQGILIQLNRLEEWIDRFKQLESELSTQE